MQKAYDLGERTLIFARRVRSFIRLVPYSIAHKEDVKQLVRSSGSIGANFREAEESLGPKDFLMKVRICRKEAKETIYWLNLLEIDKKQILEEKDYLIAECTELMRIFGSIISKYSSK